MTTLIAAVAFLAGVLPGYITGYRWHQTDASLEARTRRAEQQLSEQAARGEHPYPDDTPIDFWPSLYGPARGRPAVTAADIAPVIIPEPAGLTDTGEIRLRGQQIRARLGLTES
jgi:hypothetical protein